MIRTEARTRVEFYDVDAMRVVWHGHYVRFLELGRGKLLDSLDYGYGRMQSEGWSFPVVDLRLRYLKPAVLGQDIGITATLEEWENRLVVAYDIRDVATSQSLCRGSTTQVAVREGSDRLSFACPASLVERVERALKAGA